MVKVAALFFACWVPVFCAVLTGLRTAVGRWERAISPLQQINRTNVAQLQQVWSFDTADGPGATQTQPIMVDGVVYGLTPSTTAIALDAGTGKLLWRFSSGITGRGANRGVVYWAEGNERRIFSAVQSFIYAIDAKTGKGIPGFGKNGRIDLREDLGRDPSKQSIAITTPGIIYKDLLITGNRTPESLPAPPGDVRAYDVRTW
jgi:quinoprotein glucose dehydrogenase